MLIYDIIPPSKIIPRNSRKKKIRLLNILKPTLSSWLIVLLILQIVAGVLFSPPIEEAQADGENWLTGWSYRRPITINNTGTAISEDFQVMIDDFDTATLVTASKMRSDGYDIRFTRSNGSTVMPYWIESGMNTSTTDIWVKVTADSGVRIPNGDSTIYMYYGKSDEITEASDGSTTFEFFDDDFLNIDSPWTQKATMTSGREQFGFEELNGILYTVGGQANGASQSSTYAYNISTNTWSTKASLTTPRQSPVLRAVSGKLYLIGGQNTGAPVGEKMLKDVWEYDPSTNEWTQKTDMPTKREDMASAVIDNKIYVIGGLQEGGTIIAKVEVYTPATDTWETKSDMPDPRWSADFGCAYDGKIYLISGSDTFADYPTLYPSARVDEYDPAGDSWVQKTNITTARCYKEAEEVNGKIYVMGGATDHAQTSHRDENEAYNVATDTWSTKTDVPIAVRGAGMASYNGKVYYCGGSTGSGSDTAQGNLYEYDPAIEESESKWTEELKGTGASINVSNGECELHVPDDQTCSASIKSVATFTKDIAIVVKRKEPNDNEYFHLTLGSGAVCDYSGGTSDWWYTTMHSSYFWSITGYNLDYKRIYEMPVSGAGGVLTDQSFAFDPTNYANYEYRYYGSAGNLKVLFDGIEKISAADTTFLNDNKNILITQGAYSGAGRGAPSFLDWVLVRKYVATEPTATVESDTTPPTGTVTVDTDPIYEGDLTQIVTVTYNETMSPGSTPTITFTGNTGAITTQSDGAWSTVALTNDTWTETFDVADANEETAAVTVSSSSATDAVGNAEGACVSDSFTIDTSAPTIALVLNDTDGYVNSAETSTGIDILITTTGVENTQTVTCNVKDANEIHTVGPLTGNIASNAVTIVSTALTTLDDGTITVSCDVSDVAGNPAPQGTDTSVKDVVAPTNVGISTIIADSYSQLTVTATAEDSGSGLAAAPYWFQETSGNSGASSSSEWQASTSFTDDGLSPNTQYTYQVKAKDTAGNESSYSDSSSKYTLSCGGGGGGLPPAAYNPPASPSPSPQNPQGEFKVLINDNAEYTNNLNVNLSLLAGKDTERMAISNFSDFRNASQIPYQKEREWNLCSSDLCLEGEYAVYAKFYTQWGQSSEIVSDTIIYQKYISKEEEESEKEPESDSELEQVEEPEQEIEQGPEEPGEIEEPGKIPEETPEQLEPEEQLEQLIRIPQSLKEIARKFSPIKDIFVKLKIRTQQDLERLKNVKLTIPNLKELISLEKPELKPEIFFQEPVKPEIKEIIPEDTLFFTSSEDKIHINTELTSLDKEKPEQEVNLVSGHIIKVIVKPSSSVKSIKAQFTLREKSQSINSNPKHSFSDLFVSSVLAQNADTRFVLAEFELTDPDEDGIYTAEFQSPLVAGEYELIALLDFEDEDIQNKELRVITLVDPEGYVYESKEAKELRIPNAKIALHWFNPETQGYQLWQADEYQQINPQITRETGEYSFLVPEGTYYLKVEADRYLTFQTELFEVREGEGIHKNIELHKSFWQDMSWRWIALSIILVMIFVLLSYNFYRDRNRKELMG